MKSKLLSPSGIAAGLACGFALSANLGAATIDFGRDIEPILIKRCSECHGPDQQKSNLRLDSRAAALKAGKSGALALVPGQPDASELMKRITSTDSDEVMPPKGGRLTDIEVATMRQWIADGAVWPEVDATKHWAFQRPSRPEPPKVSRWAKNEIDRFILARLDKEGLQPQPEADRYTLARRVHLDLTGLPPTWEQVHAFVNDTSPEA